MCILLVLLSACGRLPALTPAGLAEAEQKWKAVRPSSYRLSLEMVGDRVETGHFEVVVRAGQVVSLRRNGVSIDPERGQDYSMEGLFHMLRQELGLAEKPATLGAPGGYSAYLMARFNDTNGGLIQYRRTVGGTSNSIEVKVLTFEPQ